jgi:hypothetical protein
MLQPTKWDQYYDSCHFYYGCDPDGDGQWTTEMQMGDPCTLDGYNNEIFETNDCPTCIEMFLCRSMSNADLAYELGEIVRPWPNPFGTRFVNKGLD